MPTNEEKWEEYYRKYCVDPFPVRIGVDEIGTETQTCEGWNYFCLPERYVADFTKDAQSILKKSKIKGFHAKKFKPKFSTEYKEFLVLIRNYISKSPQALAVNTLLSAKIKEEFLLFGHRVLKGALLTAGVEADVAFDTISPYISRLFTLARVTNCLGPKLQMNVELDKHSSLVDLNSIVHKDNDKSISANLILKAFYNGYAKKQFPKAPLLSDDGISVMKDEKSVFIQAADIIGNFSMNYVFVKLGKKSKTREPKASLIEEVFGSTIEKWDFSRLILQNDDLIIRDDGELKFQVGWDVTKCPDNAWLKAQGLE